MAIKKVELIEIRPIELRSVTLRVVGDTPLIMHAWSEKARKEMLDKQTKKTTTKAREANREKLAAQQKAYREANREKVAAKKKAWYEANREKINEKRRRKYREKRIRNQDGV